VELRLIWAAVRAIAVAGFFHNAPIEWIVIANAGIKAARYGVIGSLFHDLTASMMLYHAYIRRMNSWAVIEERMAVASIT
jgi:hypothetical protein